MEYILVKDNNLVIVVFVTLERPVCLEQLSLFQRYSMFSHCFL